jgi:HlyD family secretion protein
MDFGLRKPARILVWLALVSVVAIVIAVWWLQSGTAAEPSSGVIRVGRGDLVVSVGGVGRIVDAGASSQIAVPSTAGSGAAGSGTATGSGGAPAAAGSGGGPTSAPADGVFPRANGNVSRLLVAPGQHVRAGEALAYLDDGGVAAGALLQARIELATARLELRQKRTSDPLVMGIPPTPEEVAAGRSAVLSARERLARLLGPPIPVDLSVARADLRRAEAELETLVGGTSADRAEAINLARHNVQLAQERLDRILRPPDPVDVATAQLDVMKADAELADLLRTQPPPPPETLAAARQAVAAARLKLAKILGPADPADVTAARLDLERAQADLRRLQAGPSAASLASARQAVRAARARVAQLQGPPLESDVTAARLDVDKAVADLAVLRARGGPATPFDVSLAQLKIDAARARLALARFDARQLTVRAPATGTVTALLTATGAPVDATTPIATVAGLDHLAVSLDLSEFDVAQVRPGMHAVVSVDALGGEAFRGKVLFAALTGNDTGGVVTFPVRVSLARAAGLRPGMNVSVRIIVAAHRDVVQVPLEAVSRDEEDRPLATVVDDSGETTTRRLVLGLANNKSVEVVKGLDAGEQVELAEAPEEGGGGE